MHAKLQNGVKIDNCNTWLAFKSRNSVASFATSLHFTGPMMEKQVVDGGNNYGKYLYTVIEPGTCPSTRELTIYGHVGMAIKAQQDAHKRGVALRVREIPFFNDENLQGGLSGGRRSKRARKSKKRSKRMSKRRRSKRRSMRR